MGAFLCTHRSAEPRASTLHKRMGSTEVTDAQLGREMSEEQARNLLAEAGKLAKPGMLGFGGRKYDEAADVCKKAANIYKMLKKGAWLPHPYLPFCAMHKHTVHL